GVQETIHRDDPLEVLCIYTPIGRGSYIGSRPREPERGLNVLCVVSAFEVQGRDHFAEPVRKTVGELQFQDAGVAGKERRGEDVALERQRAVKFSAREVAVEG